MQKINNYFDMTKINPEKFKKAWFSFEEIQQVQDSLDEYNKTEKSYSLQEAEAILDAKIFSKAKSPSV